MKPNKPNRPYRICHVTFGVGSPAELEQVLDDFGSMGLLHCALITPRPDKRCLPAGWKAVKTDGGWTLEQAP
jgi:hypothetical protein